MKSLLALAAISAIGTSAALASAQTPAPLIANRPTAAEGPSIRIDPRGLSGGAGGDVATDAGLIVLDPLTGSTSVVVPQAPATTLPLAGQNAVAGTSTPTTLEPSPRFYTYPFCRNRTDERCRVR
jgi:hypothetical protein